MKIVSIVGTRPQFLKLAPLCFKLRGTNINHIIVHTGQHFNNEMSLNLFKTLELPEPDYHLERQGETYGEFNGYMMMDIEKVLLKEKPDKVIVFGDCDTTVVGAMVSKRLGIFLVHIESGMRSYNKDMPEEINRVLTDHMSDLLLCSTQDSVENLKKENIVDNVLFVGNLQLDLLQTTLKKYQNEEILDKHSLQKENFILLTLHRSYNTNELSLKKMFLEFAKLGQQTIFPIHPRTRNVINKFNLDVHGNMLPDNMLPDNILLIDPVNYLDMVVLERNCSYIITDSGGVQPEAWFLNKRCIVMRTETEWTEPLKNRNSVLFDYKTPLKDFIDDFLKKGIVSSNSVKTDAAKKIVKYLLK